MRRRRVLTGLGALAGQALASSGNAERGVGAFGQAPHRSLSDLLSGQWVPVHSQAAEDRVRFRRQAHGGSAMDPMGRRLILFGSDTHGKDWSNTPYLFDLSELTWSRPYVSDDPGTYRVNDAGLAVAGPMGDRPWAMHTFGALCYDPGTARLFVSSFPAHLEPGRFTNAMARRWPSVKRHPTWVLSVESGEWRALDAEPIHFFACFTVFDQARRVIVGCRPDGVYELDPEVPIWRKVHRQGVKRYHTNGAYDDWHGVVLQFGGNGLPNDVVVFEPRSRVYRIMPTPGRRPAGDQHVPVTFHSGRGELIALVDRLTPGKDPTARRLHRTETWGYSFGRDAWTHYETASIPFALGMNYNLEYDAASDCLILAADEPGRLTSVWALRL